MSSRRPLRLLEREGRVEALAELATALARGDPVPDREAAAVFGDAILAWLGAASTRPYLDSYLGVRPEPRSKTTAQRIYRLMNASGSRCSSASDQGNDLGISTTPPK